MLKNWQIWQPFHATIRSSENCNQLHGQKVPKTDEQGLKCSDYDDTETGDLR